MDNLNQSGQRVVEIDEANPISLLKNPEKFKDTFYELASIGSQALKGQQHDKAIKALNKCLDMLDLGKNIMKDGSKYWKLCIYGDLACAYQGTWKMQKCHKFCEKIEEELEKLIESAECKQSSLNLTKFLIRIKFQHCAILSQLSHHDKALFMCQSTLPILKTYIQSILEYSESLKANRADKKSSETVHFSKHVCAFAEQILSNLVKCLKQPLKLNIDKTSFYYWQKNPENNEKQVQKKFVSYKSSDTCKRSILGVNKMSHWIDQFNIGSIMHMSELTINDFEQTIPIQEYIFKDKLYETVIHCSIAHFTIATQMRFIDSNKEKQKNQQAQNKPEDQLSGINKFQSIHRKCGYEEKSEMFRISELYHLQAINIMAQNIKTTVPYISHLIKSYDKHYIYKKQLDPVIAIAEQSLMSVNETNPLSINKKDFGLSSSNKAGSNMINEENEGDHYFTNSNINMGGGGNQLSNGNGPGYDRQFHYHNKVYTENIQILDQLEDDPIPNKSKINKKRQKKHSISKPQKQHLLQPPQQQISSISQQGKMAPNYFQTEQSQHHSSKKARNNKSSVKSKTKGLPHKSVKKDDLKKMKKKQNKEKDKKKATEQQKQFRVRHQSSTQIRVVCKKKK